MAVLFFGIIAFCFFLMILRIPKTAQKQEPLQVTSSVTENPTIAPNVTPQARTKLSDVTNKPETSTKFSPRKSWNTYVNIKENLPTSLKPKFVSFSFDYPTSFKVQPQSDVNFVKVEKYAGAGEDNTSENFAVGYAWFDPPSAQSDTLYNMLLDRLGQQLSGTFHNYKELKRISVTIDGVQSRAALFQADFNDAAKTMIYGKTIVVHPPGKKNGVAILILGTSLSRDIKSAEDLGVKGDTAEIFHSFSFL